MADLSDAQRFAELIVEVGANIQEGQDVELLADLGTEEVVRAIAGAAYRKGARFVDVWWWDALLKRERLLHARAETLDYVPPEPGARLLRLGEERGCRIWIIGNPEPHALEGVDPERAGRDLLPRLKESAEVVMARTTNWCIASWPTQGWARQVFPSLEPAVAFERLRRELAHVSRLDEPDPAEAWRARVAELKGAAGRLAERAFDSLHFSGPGTDLSVGLFRSGGWHAGSLERIDGLESIVNIPTEEVFTTPDPARVEGVVRATKPLELAGSLIDGIVVRFEGGRAVQIDADSNVDVLRCHRGQGRGRGAPRRARARRRLRADRSARDRLLEHPARRERREPHRTRRLLRVRGRGRGGARAREPERDPRRLHDRQPRGRRRRDHDRRRDRPCSARRCLADLS